MFASFAQKQKRSTKPSTKGSKARRRSKTLANRRRHFIESLEPRIVLNAAPLAIDDPHYYTAEDTALTITTSDVTLLDNDWDAEGDTLTASVVDNPPNGTLSGFTGSSGTFTYTPNTAFVGVDTFTYKLNDGTDDSNVVTVSVAVGGQFGAQTNLSESYAGGGGDAC